MVSYLAIIPLLAVASAAPFKRAESQLIHINGDATKVRVDATNLSQCLSVDKLENGAPVVNVLCDNGFHNAWTIQDGNNVQGVRLTGTEFCLDAGSKPGNFGQAKIWTCYPGLKQQTWWYTGDKHLAITNGDQCLDAGQDYVQTYRCFYGNTNQIWTLSSATPPPPPPPPVDPTGPVMLHFKGSSTGCVSVSFGGVGGSVFLSECSSPGLYSAKFEQFDVKRNTPGLIRNILNPDVCLDASPFGPNTNGSIIKLQTCDPTLQQQQWYYTNDNHLAIVGGNQCMQVVKDSVPNDGVLQDIHTWQCDGSDPQQVFTL